MNLQRIWSTVAIVTSTFLVLNTNAQKDDSANHAPLADDFLGLWVEGGSGSIGNVSCGSLLTSELADHVLEVVDPDWMLCPCRHHDGISQYATKFGRPVDNIERDPIRTWREASRKRNVRLFVHFTALWDFTIMSERPEWCALNRIGGRNNSESPSIFGPYMEKYFLPHLKELIDMHSIDGAIIDGDFRFRTDYSTLAARAFKEATGLPMPLSVSDKHFRAYMDFHRSSYVAAHNKYVESLRAYAPGFIVSQPIFYRPFHVETGGAMFDFIYGLPSIHTTIFGSGGTRIRSKVMSAQKERPWFMHTRSLADWGIRSLRSPCQWKQEVAVGIAHGGGAGLLLQQRRGSGVDEDELSLVGEVAAFCRERQEVCHKAKSIPQVAVLFSHSAFYEGLTTPFSPSSSESNGLVGIIDCLVDAQEHVDVLLETHMDRLIDDYRLVIWSGYSYTPPHVKERLLKYVRDGGMLLVSGRDATRAFDEECGITIGKGMFRNENAITVIDGYDVVFGAAAEPVTAGKQASVIRKYQTHQREDSLDMIGFFPRSEERPLTTITSYGKGQIGAMHLDMGAAYLSDQQFGIRKIVLEAVRMLFHDPMLNVEGSRFVDVTLMEKKGRINVNLVNTAGDCRNENVYTYDDIPPVGPVSITVRTNRKPNKVLQEPAGTELDYSYNDSMVSVTLPRIEIHEIISLVFDE